jgi:hypothetical protein
MYSIVLERYEYQSKQFTTREENMSVKIVVFLILCLFIPLLQGSLSKETSTFQFHKENTPTRFVTEAEKLSHKFLSIMTKIGEDKFPDSLTAKTIMKYLLKKSIKILT